MAAVSVIIPNYNHAEFLESRIRSVLNQTYSDFEVIILDDKSTDDSLGVIMKYSNHPKVKTVLCNEFNSGSTFKQWLKGIEIASGELIWIAESDDIADTTFLQQLVGVLSKYPEVDLVYSNSFIIDKEGKILFSFKYKERWPNAKDDRWTSFNIIEREDELINYMIWGTSIPNASAVLFRKNSFLKYCPYNITDFRITGDWYAWVNFLLKGKIAYIPKSLNYFRNHLNSQSSSGLLSKEKIILVEGLRVIDFIYNNLKFSRYKRDEAIQAKINRFFINRGLEKKVLIQLLTFKMGIPLKFYPYIFKYYIKSIMKKVKRI